MQTLLEKTRILGRFIQEGAGGRSDPFKEIAQAVSQLTQSSVYIIGRRRRMWAYKVLIGTNPVYEDSILNREKDISATEHEWLWSFRFTEANYREKDGYCYTIVPVFAAGERLATLLLAKEEEDFSTDDLILSEYAATIIGLEILRLNSDRIEHEARKRASVDLALDVLSYSELEAVKTIFNEFDGEEGFVVASKLAEEYNLTRSVIVNALRKLESAGVIDSRSLGVKGTYIRVLNDYFLDKLELTTSS